MAVYAYCRDLSTTKPKTIFVAVLIASSSKAFEPNFDNSRQIRNVYNRTIQVYCVLRLAIRSDLT